MNVRTKIFFFVQGTMYMSPVSPVIHTEAAVSIGLKTYLEWEHPFYNIGCPCCEAELAKTFLSNT